MSNLVFRQKFEKIKISDEGVSEYMKIANAARMKELLQQHGFHFSKSLGQNFLINPSILEDIVEAAKITKEDYVLEIGPGAGSLTQYLAEHAKKVVAVELDTKVLPILEKTLESYSNVRIIHGDVLKVDLRQIIQQECEGQSIKVVANLPYYITTPIIMGLLEKELPITNIVVMVQKEVAERMSAEPGGKEYGALSVAVQYYTNPRMVTVVPPHCFIPQPKIDSMVIALDVLTEPKIYTKDKQLFFKVVKAAFAQRRKTLINSLVNAGDFHLNKEEWKVLLESIGLNEKVRGETLSLENFANITNLLLERQ